MAEVLVITGSAIRAHLDVVAALRIAVFRDWPYLYDGDYRYEREYLRVYAEAPNAVVVLALAGDTTVGASTGAPLDSEPDFVRAPFAAAGIPTSSTFYYGESVVLEPYRHQGIGVRFFEAREQHAREHGYGVAAFCGVERPETHPARPPLACDADRYWRRRGFEPTDLLAHFAWRDVDEPAVTTKPMRFWQKTLR